MDIDNYFRAQFGLVTRDQAGLSGLSDRQINCRLKSGQWVRVHAGVYQLGAVPDSWESALLAACLSSGGIASHRCAAALWNLEVYRYPPIEITVREGRSTRRAIARLHETRQWVLRDESTVRGIRCTGVERTILDCAGVVGFRRTERLAEAAIRKNLTSWSRLASCLMNHSKRGRNGCLTLRQLLESRVGRPTVPLSDFSRLVANLLASSGVPEPVLEHRIVDAAGTLILQTDLAWPQHKKAWELDGLAWHFGRTEIERDRRKRNRAKAHGWTIQEILWSMYAEDPDQLVGMAKMFLSS